MYVVGFHSRNAIKIGPAGELLAVFTTADPPLSYPTGVYVSSDGDTIWISDQNFTETGTSPQPDRVVRLNSSGSLLANYTTESPPLRWPEGLFVDSAGALFVAR